MPNYRCLSDTEVAKEADRYADIVPRELVAELIYRLRRSTGLTVESTLNTGERTGDITGRNAPWVPFGKGEQQEITGNEIDFSQVEARVHAHIQTGTVTGRFTSDPAPPHKIEGGPRNVRK